MSNKTDKKMMTDDEWNAWTADVKTFVANKDEVMRLTSQAENDESLRNGEAFDADNFEDDFEDIVNFLKRGATRIAMREITRKTFFLVVEKCLFGLSVKVAVLKCQHTNKPFLIKRMQFTTWHLPLTGMFLKKTTHLTLR